MGETLKNLRDEINLDGFPKFYLDEVINGHYFWEILQLEQKLEGRLPDDVNVKEFRGGYISAIDIETFEKTIGDDEDKKKEIEDKKAKGMKDVFVISTREGDIFELDDDILQPKELGTPEEQLRASNSNIRYENGKETEKPESHLTVGRRALYQIPDANKNFNVDENWYLTVDYNRGWRDNGERGYAGNKIEVSFAQVSGREDYYDREVRVKNAIEYKLKPTNESEFIPGREKDEIEQREELKEKDPYEAQNERKEHMDELVQEICNECKGWDEMYNKGDIEKMVENYHKQGLNDEETKDKVKEDIEEARDFEHDMPNLYDKKLGH